MREMVEVSAAKATSRKNRPLRTGPPGSFTSTVGRVVKRMVALSEISG